MAKRRRPAAAEVALGRRVVGGGGGGDGSAVGEPREAVLEAGAPDLPHDDEHHGDHHEPEEAAAGGAQGTPGVISAPLPDEGVGDKGRKSALNLMSPPPPFQMTAARGS